MHHLDQLYSELEFHLANQPSPETIQALGHSLLLSDHELLQAAYTVLVQKQHLNPKEFSISSLKSGAVPLFQRGFFPWGALPYPKEHALLGTLLFQIHNEQLKKIARGMAIFQDATLDHHKKPLRAFLDQEGRVSCQSLEEANIAFFKAASYFPTEDLHFADYDLGIIVKRSKTMTLSSLGTGCKSGMGSFLFHEAGIVNYGPQLIPAGDCNGFGLAGRARKLFMDVKKEHFALSYLCSVAAPHGRAGFGHLKDSGYSALWIKATIESDFESLSMQVHFEGYRQLKTFVFVIFGKGDTCLVAGSHQLKPRSLDRYQGPPQPVAFLSQSAGVCAESIAGASSMEVIPLAGDESYWGSDFLVVYTLASPIMTWKFFKK